MIDPPRRISDRTIELSLTGMVTSMFHGDHPHLLGMPGTLDLFVAVFSDPESLESMFRDYGIDPGRIVQITDGVEFVDSIPLHIRIAVDPHRHTNGMLRFKEVLR